MYSLIAWIMQEYSKGRGAQSPPLIPLRSHSWLLSGEFLAPAFRRMLRSPEFSRAVRDDLGVFDVTRFLLKYEANDR